MTIQVAIDVQQHDIDVTPLHRTPSSGVVHRVMLAHVVTARADVEIILNLTAGRAESLADQFADVANELRRRDAAKRGDDVT
jgi:hypothetical protein